MSAPHISIHVSQLVYVLQEMMMTTYHNYLVTSLDLHMVNLDDFKYGGTNVTAFRLLDPEREEVRQVVQGRTDGSNITLTFETQTLLSCEMQRRQNC